MNNPSAGKASIISLFSQSSPSGAKGWLGRVCTRAKYALMSQMFYTEVNTYCK